MSPSDFADLIRRVRAGDEAAANDLFQRYHKVLYRTVAIRLQNQSLQAEVDVEDICQTVFKSFFVRVRLGQYELPGADDFINLILRMAHNKLTAKQRKRQVRPEGRASGEPLDSEAVAQPGPMPSEVLSRQELLRAALGRLTAEERQLLDLRDRAWSGRRSPPGWAARARRGASSGSVPGRG